MEAAVPRPAATVLLVRDGPDGVQVYLQRRPRRLGFAGGLWVYPGGRVDDADADPAVDDHWSGPPPSAWARRLGVDEATARGYVVAACRETLEEAGVLLGRPGPPPDALAAARRELLSGRRRMVEVLGDLGVRLDTDVLRYWAWWVTPAGEPRRYDTRFFVAALPRGATVHPHTGEVTGELWAGGRERAEGLAMLPPTFQGPAMLPPTFQTPAMLPPTFYTLRDVTAFDTVADVVARGRDRTVERVEPVLANDAILLPWGDRYPMRPPPPGHETR